MRSNPAFELFESICMELAERGQAVFADEDFDERLVNELEDYFDQTDSTVAIGRGITAIKTHFVEKGAALPFTFDAKTREFVTADKDYVRFIALASELRGVGKQSSEFESRTIDRLALRVTGDLHRVGWPRKRHKKKADFVSYLEQFGFERNCIEGKDKDGGLDILWLPPLGSVPLRPLVSLQCKNGSFCEEDANSSVLRANKTMQRHSHLRGHNQLCFVVFNDYIDMERFDRRAVGMGFVPLGLSDLTAAPATPVRVVKL